MSGAWSIADILTEIARPPANPGNTRRTAIACKVCGSMCAQQQRYRRVGQEGGRQQ